MIRIFATLVGKLIQTVLRIRGSGGQALPGLIIEKLAPNYLPKMLSQVPEGVIVVTGTNGKTTTTKMVVELLESEGKKVLTNSTGSNLTRGIISSIAQKSNWLGKLDFDIAVYELDEAFAKQFTKVVAPRWVLALNVSRDQLDRFGEVDAVARLIGETMAKATEGVVTNSNDPLLVSAINNSKVKVNYFGISEAMQKFFPTDSEIVAVGEKPKPQVNRHQSLVELSNFSDHEVTFIIDGSAHKTSLNLDGQHNFLNAAAALTLVISLLPNYKIKKILNELSELQPAFGRGEYYTLRDGSHLQLALVKNPASFRQSLASYLSPSTKVMIAINDNYADSRDMSWLWDVDFTPLKDYRLSLTTGSRAADMALRLKYDDVEVNNIEPELGKALKLFCSEPGDKLILSSYTAMLWLHSTLSKQAGKNL